MLLSASELTYRIARQTLVDEVSLTVGSGELVAVVGPNGAGKSTLLSMLAGDLRPSAGAVRLDGAPVSSYRPIGLARKRAVLPQRSSLQFAFTVAEVVELGRHAARSADDARLVAEALAATDMESYAGRNYLTLSGGERARADLARVLAQDTPLLLLDEPTAAVDLRHQHSILRLVRDLTARGRAVVAVLHDLNLAAAYATRIAVLSGGRLVRDGVPADVVTPELIGDVFEHPVHVTPHPETGRPVVIP
jgi:iron complex transport system ATP-binding protein